MATADVNGDGNLDLVGEFFVMLGMGNGKFQNSMPLSQTSLAPAGRKLTGAGPAATSIIGSTVALADLNGDGFIDAVVTGPLETGGSMVALGKGNGSFGPLKLMNLPQNGASVAIADFNGDGKPDLAFSLVTGGAAVCLGNGDGTFQAPRTHAAGNFPGQSIVTADLNGDGKTDIILVELNRNGGTLAMASPLAVLYGIGDGTFKPAAIYETIFPFGVAVGDLNGDGISDVLVTGGIESDPLLFVFLGASNGRLEAATNFNAQTIAPESFAWGDFNGDGILWLGGSGPDR